MTGLALALAAGAALPSTGLPTLPVTLLLLAALWRPISSGRRPVRPRLRWLPAAMLAGLAHGSLEARSVLDDCRWRRAAGSMEVVGWVREIETPTRVRLEVVEAGPGGCSGAIRVQGRLPTGVGEGATLRARGRWIARAGPLPGLDPIRAGLLLAGDVGRQTVETRGLGPRWASVRAMGIERIERRFKRESDLVSALVFARRDGLDPELRDEFAATGTAHLLAISGFHVGVLVGAIIWTLGRLVPPRRAFAAGTGAAWIYVGVLGFPDAATRAALLLTLVTLGRLVGRPVSGAGAPPTVAAATSATSIWKSLGWIVSLARACWTVSRSTPTRARRHANTSNSSRRLAGLNPDTGKNTAAALRFSRCAANPWRRSPPPAVEVGGALLLLS